METRNEYKQCSSCGNPIRADHVGNCPCGGTMFRHNRIMQPGEDHAATGTVVVECDTCGMVVKAPGRCGCGGVRVTTTITINHKAD